MIKSKWNSCFRTLMKLNRILLINESYIMQNGQEEQNDGQKKNKNTNKRYTRKH